MNASRHLNIPTPACRQYFRAIDQETVEKAKVELGSDWNFPMSSGYKSDSHQLQS